MTLQFYITCFSFFVGLFLSRAIEHFGYLPSTHSTHTHTHDLEMDGLFIDTFITTFLRPSASRYPGLWWQMMNPVGTKPHLLVGSQCCAECGKTSHSGAQDSDSGVWYCALCWERYYTAIQAASIQFGNDLVDGAPNEVEGDEHAPDDVGGDVESDHGEVGIDFVVEGR